MGKRGGFPGMGGMNINKLLKEAKKMQADMESSQAELKNKVFESTAGGGAVTAKVNGTKKLIELKISEDLMSSEDKEMLEDLVILCVNNAIEKVEAEENEITGSINMPGLGL